MQPSTIDSVSMEIQPSSNRNISMDHGVPGVGVEAEHPPSFYCPISQQCMHDPVVLCDGHSYERRHIARWLQEHDTSPVSGLHLKQKCAFPNHALRNAIEEYFQKVFELHRRAIRKSISKQKSFGTNGALLETMDGLVQCSLLVNADLSTESALRCIMEEAKVLVGAEVASVFLVDHIKQQLYSTVNSTDAELRIPISSGIAGHVATSGESVRVEDAYSDDRFDRSVDKKTGFRTRTIICVPIKAQKGKILGVAQLINRTGNGMLATLNSKDGSNQEFQIFSMEDLHFLRVFAAQAAAAIENSDSYESSVSSEMEGHSNSTKQAVALSSPKSKQTAMCLEAQSAESEAEESSKPKAPSLTLSRSLSPKNKKFGYACTPPSCGSPSGKPYSPNQHRERKEQEFTTATLENVLEDLLNDAYTSWQIDIWTINRASQNKALSTLGCYLFQRLGLVETFNIDQHLLKNFFEEIEKGYGEHDIVPYHNSVHVASVLHLMHMLLSQGGVAETLNAQGHCGKLEVLACLLAAAIHDHGHRGLTNNFLVKSSDEMALRYNDQHVNEHQHICSGFSVLRRPECNFLLSLSAAQYSRLRSLIINLVLGTDMADDKKIVTSLNHLLEASMQSGDQANDVEKSSKVEAAFTPASEQDATIGLQMALKCADVGHLTLAWEDHLVWVHRLEREFFEQGDKEKEMNMEPSFLMDRNKPGVTQTQVGFFDFVALPLYRTLTTAFPLAKPMLSGVEANYQRWCEIDAAKAATAKGRTVA